MAPASAPKKLPFSRKDLCNSQEASPMSRLRPNVPRACVNCRKMKKRCGFERPCRWCITHGQACLSPPPKERRRRSDRSSDTSPVPSSEADEVLLDGSEMSSGYPNTEPCPMESVFTSSAAYNSDRMAFLSSLDSSPASSISNGSIYEAVPLISREDPNTQSPGDFLTYMDSCQRTPFQIPPAHHIQYSTYPQAYSNTSRNTPSTSSYMPSHNVTPHRSIPMYQPGTPSMRSAYASPSFSLGEPFSGATPTAASYLPPTSYQSYSHSNFHSAARLLRTSQSVATFPASNSGMGQATMPSDAMFGSCSSSYMPHSNFLGLQGVPSTGVPSTGILTPPKTIFSPLSTHNNEDYADWLLPVSP